MRTLEAFELREGGWVLKGALSDDDPVRLRPFEAVGWPMGALWADRVTSWEG